MPTKVQFNGVTTGIPGSYAKVDASGLARPGTGASGIVAVIGEAEGGEPNAVYEITNPGVALRTFRDGDLREAALFLFDPSADDAIPAGAQRGLFVKVNPAVQSSRSFLDGDGGASLTLTSKDYGLFTAQIGVEIADGTDGGKLVTVTFDGTTEEFDNCGADPWFTIALVSAAGSGLDFTAALDPTVGFTLALAASETDAADYGFLTFAGKDNERDAADGSSAITVVSDSASDTGSITIYGVVGGSPDSETLTLTGTSPVTGAKTFTAVHGVYMAATAVGTVSVKRSSTTITAIDPGGQAAGLNLFSGGIENNGGAPYFLADAATTSPIMLIGQVGGTPTLEIVTLNGTTPVASSNDWDYFFVGALNLASARTITVRGILWQSGQKVRLVSSSASDTQVATIYGASVSGTLQSATVTLNGTTPVLSSGVWGAVYGVRLASASVGTITVKDEAQTLTAFTFSAAQSVKGGHYTANYLEVFDEALAFTTASAGQGGARQLVVYGLDDDGVATAERLSGASGTSTTVWSRVDFVATSILRGSAWTLSGTIADCPVATYPTLGELIERLTAHAALSVARVRGADGDIADMDLTDTTALSTSDAGFYGVLQDIVDAVTTGSQLVEAAADDDATAPPANTASRVYLTGGSEGTTLFAHWQAALDLLKNYDCNTVVPLTSSESVHAAAKAHAVWAAAQGRSDRDVVLGAAAGETLAQLRERAVALGTRHCRLCFDSVVRQNVDGSRETFPPYFTGLLAAGMQAGTFPGNPLTWKYVNIVSATSDDSVNLHDFGESVLDAGLHGIEKVPGVGWRWFRGITTHLKDSNIAYVEASVNHAVNYAIREFRRGMEIAVGEPGFDGTVAAAKGAAVSVLGRLVALGVITSWDNLNLTLADDQLTVDVQIAPVLPINFVTSTLHLVTTTISLAA